MKDFKIIELMELFDEGEVIPASQMQRPQSALDREMFEDANKRFNQADGGRIGFRRGTDPEGQKKGKALYDKLYKEYVNLIDKGFKKEKLTTKDVPQWETFVKNKGFKTPSVMYYADERGSPAGLLKDKKIELVKDIIARENNKLDGMYPFKGGKGGASSLFIGKVTNNRLGTSTTVPGNIEFITTKLVRETLDKRDDKILKALRVVMNPDYRLTNSVTTEISNLIKGEAGVGVKNKDVLKTLRTFSEYKSIEPDIKYINRIISKLPKGTDTSMGYLLELSQNNTLGRVSFDDWWRLAGDKPEQFAMREALRNWNTEKGKGQFKFYDLNGKPITWKGKGQSLDSNKVLFSYADPNDLGYKNKLYGVFKPDSKTFTKINKNLPNKDVFDLKGNIRNLPEWNELVEVTDGRNKLFNTDMINPLTGKKEKYKDVFEDIYKNVKTTALTTKEGYSKIKSMAGHIDHERGTKVLPFNNLRIVTGQQNQFFNTLSQASEKAANPNLKSYINALSAEVYPLNSSIDDQIASIINETSEIGKVVKANKGKPITLPSVTEVASSRFLKNKIPNLPEDVVNYLTPKAQKAEQIYKETPALKNVNVNNLQKLLASFSANPKCRVSFGKGNKDGGRIGYANGPANLVGCADSGSKRLEKVIKTGVKLGPQEGALATQILRAGRSLGSAFTLSGLLGPQALLFTGLAEAGFVGYDYLTTGKTLKEVIGDSLLNYALGEKTKIDPTKELFKRFSGLGYSDEQLGNFANVLNQTNTLNTLLKQDLKVGNLKDQVKALREQPKDTFLGTDDDLSQTDQAIRAEQKLKDESLNLDNLLTNYRKEPNIGTPDFQGTQFSLPSMEDTILGDMASGKFQDTQQDLKAANIFADLQKQQTARDNFLRFTRGDISKQARADRIAGLEQDYLNLIKERGPELTPFAGGGIAGLSGGIDEGPQVESMNPDSQGLQGLMKRARNI